MQVCVKGIWFEANSEPVVLLMNSEERAAMAAMPDEHNAIAFGPRGTPVEALNATLDAWLELLNKGTDG